MKKLFNCWLQGADYLFTDELVSHYAYFTAILCEIAFVWAFLPADAIALTILLSLCIVNVLACSFVVFKGYERVVSKIYLINFLIIFITGCCVNLKTFWLLMLIPFIVSIVWFIFKGYQLAYYVEEYPYKSIKHAIIIFLQKVIEVLLQIIVTFAPIIVFAIFLSFTSIPIVLKIVIPLTYLLIVPFISNMEDSWAGTTIFGMVIDYWM